jgi:two-component system phosphate regulon response regulator OmpR
MTRIIVVEQDVEQKEQLLCFLSHAGHEVRGACNGEEMNALLKRFTPHIALLDCDGKSEHEDAVMLTRQLHDRYKSTIGIIVVSSHDDIRERVACRLAGADHHLLKPIIFNELLAIIDNLAQRLTPSSRDQAWRLLATESALSIPDHPLIELTGWEYTVLCAIAASPNQQIDRANLIRAIGKNPEVYDQRALEAGMSRLRRKLPPVGNGSALQAVRGTGYRLNHPVAILR